MFLFRRRLAYASIQNKVNKITSQWHTLRPITASPCGTIFPCLQIYHFFYRISRMATLLATGMWHMNLKIIHTAQKLLSVIVEMCVNSPPWLVLRQICKTSWCPLICSHSLCTNDTNTLDNHRIANSESLDERRKNNWNRRKGKWVIIVTHDCGMCLFKFG